MNQQEMKDLWCQELQSGKHLQGKTLLFSQTGEKCCLGVLTDILKDQVGGKWEKNFVGGPYCFVKEGCVPEVTVAPFPIQILIGLKTNAGIFHFETLPKELQDEIKESCPYAVVGQATSLVQINDTGGSFDLIARIIKANPVGLFVENKE